MEVINVYYVHLRHFSRFYVFVKAGEQVLCVKVMARTQRGPGMNGTTLALGNWGLKKRA